MEVNMYTLKLTSLDWLANRPEHTEMTLQSAKTLRENGWKVIIVDLPSYRRDDGVMSTARQRIEASREISYLGGIREYWDTKLIGYEAERIGLVFSNAHIHKRFGNNLESSVVRHSRASDHFWWSWDCTTSDCVEIFVEGGMQLGQDNFLKFLCLLGSWDKKFRMTKKLHQLIAVATQQNQGAIERLQGEILELLVTL